MARISLKEALERPSTVDRERIATTTEQEIAQHMRSDGIEPETDTSVPWQTVMPPAAVREAYGMTQAAFAAWIGVPLATWRNWEQGRTLPEPAARTLLNLLAREPDAARRALGPVAA